MRDYVGVAWPYLDLSFPAETYPIPPTVVFSCKNIAPSFYRFCSLELILINKSIWLSALAFSSLIETLCAKKTYYSRERTEVFLHRIQLHPKAASGAEYFSIYFILVFNIVTFHK